MSSDRASRAFTTPVPVLEGCVMSCMLAHSLMLRRLRHAFGVHCVPIQIVDV